METLSSSASTPASQPTDSSAPKDLNPTSSPRASSRSEASMCLATPTPSRSVARARSKGLGMGKQHWMKFFPSDWRSDSALRSCSAAARGLWIDMIAFMHEADPRGSLLIGGQSPTPAKLAALCAMTVDETVVLLAELEGAGVFSRKKNGIIFSRRMERDEAVSRKASLSGRMGGNPVLKHSNNMNTEKESSENLSRIKGESAELRDGVTPEDTTEKQEPLKHNDKPRSYMLEAREERKKGKEKEINKKKEIIIYGKNHRDLKIIEKYNQLKKLGFTNVYIYFGGLFEWLLLKEYYGEINFPIDGKMGDISQYK